jgi:hypothetical protein
MIASEVVSAVDSELRENLMVRIARMTPPENCREFLKSFSVVEQLRRLRTISDSRKA